MRANHQASRRARVRQAIAVATLVVSAPLAAVQDGQPDPTFFGNGKFHFTTSFFAGDYFPVASGVTNDGLYMWWAGTESVGGQYYFDYAVQSLTGGGYFACAYQAPGGSLTQAGGAAMDFFGRLTIAGTTNIGGARYLAMMRVSFPESGCGLDFNLDETGGNGDGWALYSFDPVMEVRDLAIDRFGRLYVAAKVSSSSPPSNWLGRVARFLSNGHLDTSFTGGGSLLIDYNTGEDYPNAIAFGSSHGFDILWIGGFMTQTTPPRHDRDFYLQMRSIDGVLEANRIFSFDGDGDANDTLEALIWDPSRGSLYAVGETMTAQGLGIAMARLSATGNLDPSFSGDGRVVVHLTDTASAADIGVGAAVQTDGKVVVAARHLEDPFGTSDFGASRLTSGGSLDPTFDGDGRIVVPFDLGGNHDDRPIDLDLTGGRAWIGGYVPISDASSKPAMLRLWTSLIFEDGFESSIAAWQQ